MTFVRYIITQLFAYAIDLGLFITAATFFLLNPVMSNIIGKVAAGAFAFFLHRSFTFCLHSGQWNQTQAGRYFILLGLNIPLSSGLLWLLLLLNSYVVYSKVVSDIIVVAFSFWLSKLWVFTNKRPDKKISSKP